MAAWERPILVTVYPIAADEQRSTLEYARSIDADSFREVNRFLRHPVAALRIQRNPGLSLSGRGSL